MRESVPRPLLARLPDPPIDPPRVNRVLEAFVTVTLVPKVRALLMVWLPSVVVIEGALLP